MECSEFYCAQFETIYFNLIQCLIKTELKKDKNLFNISCQLSVSKIVDVKPTNDILICERKVKISHVGVAFTTY